jgi:broad specificity phosphatase PhoE
MEGLTFDEAQARWFQEITAWLEDMDKPLPGGEKQSDFATRVADFLIAIRARHRDQTLLVVSHGGPIRELLRLALGMPPDGRWAFSIDNASLTELVFFDSGARLQRLNDTCHLDNRG